VTVDGEPASEVLTCVVGLESSDAVEALAAAVVTAGFGLLDLRPVPTDLETLFLGLTSGRPPATP
jgi:hypothetical protein